MFIRQQAEVLRSRLGEPRRFIQVVAGPRQVGKSTMVKQVLDTTVTPHLFVTAEESETNDSRWIHSVWMQARQTMLLLQTTDFILTIDEIHKIDNWSNVVKAEWDIDTRENRNIKVVLLGSSRLLLKDGLSESLAGRFELIEMNHWSLREMQDAFSFTWEQYVYFGGYPGGASLIQDEHRWRKYIKDSIIEPAITKDVLLTKRIYKPALLRQLFELGCSYSGELLSFNKMLGQLQDAGNTDTLVTYLRVLEESCLLGGLHQYASDNARRYKSIPKYQVFNSALLTAETATTFADTFVHPERWGRWVETAVGTYLVNNASLLDYKVYYWRQKNDEVDFVLVRDHHVIAIEVKSGRRQNNQGIYIFSEQFHPQATFVVGGNAFHVADFLQMDLERLFSL